MKEITKSNVKANGKSNGNGAGPLLKFNHIINTLSADDSFVTWLARQPRPELSGEQVGNTTSDQKEKTSPE